MRCFFCLLTVVSLMAQVPEAPSKGLPPGCVERTGSVPTADGREVTFRYILQRPLQVDPDRTYPVILFLHGAGERGDDNRRQLTHFVQRWQDPAFAEAFPAFIVAPQCPTGSRWAEVPWDATKSSPLPSSLGLELQKALRALDDTLSAEPIDPDRVLLTGLSMGGYGSWYLACHAPDRFAAVVPVCGGGPEDSAALIRHLPIWAWHGDADRAVPVQRSRNMIDALRRAGGRPAYTELPGVGHDAWNHAYSRSGGALSWMMAQRRP